VRTSEEPARTGTHPPAVRNRRPTGRAKGTLLAYRAQVLCQGQGVVRRTRQNRLRHVSPLPTRCADGNGTLRCGRSAHAATSFGVVPSVQQRRRRSPAVDVPRAVRAREREGSRPCHVEHDPAAHCCQPCWPS
jgi:hypothetical protein